MTFWGELLQCDKIGITDNFFELGGDSMLASLLVTRLRQLFRMDVPLAVLYDANTVEKLSNYMIAYEMRPGLAEKTARLLKQIENVSEEEVSRGDKRPR